MNFDFKISKNFAVSVDLLSLSQPFSDGLDLINIDVGTTYNKDFDHSPNFTFHFEIFNFILLDFLIYNINHSEDSDKYYFNEDECDYYSNDDEINEDNSEVPTEEDIKNWMKIEKSKTLEE